MKRSEINAALRKMEEMLHTLDFPIPPFLHFTPQQWQEKGHEYDEIRDNMLGWDITDFGLGNFEETGFSLITLRNGNIRDSRYPKTYAEKLIFMQEGQTAPMHFHWYKMEDIINRGGGNVLIRVYNSDEKEGLADTPVTVHSDGREYQVPAGTQIRLCPGQSLTVTPYLYHDFSLEPGTGPVLLGEVSMCNDDNADNRFYASVGRFPTIEEDDPSYRLLCNEYPPAKD